MSDARVTLAALWRIEGPRLIAGLVRLTGDVDLAEQLAQDAVVAALERWPAEGVPRNPGAWLATTARHRTIDMLRRQATLAAKQEELRHDLEVATFGRDDLDERLDDVVGDDMLRLVFTACHPVLSVDARVALTLRLVGGLSTAEIARAFLAPEPTIAQRLVRAKRVLAEKRVPYELPTAADLPVRLASVLEVIYLVFNEGYAATAGEDWMRPGLCEDALRLGRILAELVPGEAEVHGLVAIMEIQASRMAARTKADGTPILLMEQNRTLWDPLLIRRGHVALGRAIALGGAHGPYALQAAIAACHARARTPAETDWTAIAGLYAELARRQPSPVVELNRAVAIGMAFGPAAGLELADALAATGALDGYAPLPAVRGDMLAKLGRRSEARDAFEAAAALTRNARERDVLLRRAAES